MRAPVLGFVAVLGFGVAAILAQGRGATLPLGQPGPNLPAGKAPDQGFVPDGWNPHEGGLLKYRVQIRFGEEPDTMPDGFKFGRVSAVTTDAAGDVYAFHRGAKADPMVVFDSSGKYLRSWGKGMFGNPHGLRVDRDGNIWAIDNGDHQVFKFTRDGALLHTWGTKGVAGSDDKTFGRPTDIAWDSQGQLLRLGRLRQLACREVRRGRQVRHRLGHARRRPGPVSRGSLDRHRLEGSGVRERPREQPNPDFDVERQAAEDLDAPGCTQGIFITPKDEMWVITHRNNTENITYDTLAGRLMKIDLETGKVLGSMECPGAPAHGRRRR